MHQPAILSAITAALAALPAAQAGMYPKSSKVVQFEGKNYESLIANSNYTSIVEFYAPWCGHCQNLKPAYEKAATKLEGYAKVAAIDCDDEANKPFCGGMGIQGFPTLKIVRPAMKEGGKPVVEDYNGPRTATGIVENVLQKINNHVTKITDDKLDKFLEAEKPKLILFTEKGTTSALLRSVAIAFLDVVNVGQVRNKEKAAVEKFGIEKFPSLVLIPGPGQDPVVYDGELNKNDISAFLKQVAEPNPDPAPKKKKASKPKPAKEEKKKPKAEPEEVPEEKIPEETPAAAAAPAIIPINAIADEAQLNKECLQKSSHTCVLAFVPAEIASSDDATKAVDGLSQLSTKYMHAKRHVFPFFSLPADVTGAAALREALSLDKDVEMIALNARRGWWRHYTGSDLSPEGIEAWIDALRLGEGEKKKLPEGVVKAEEPVEEAKSTKPESESVEAVHGTGTEAEIETEAPKETVEKVEDLKEEKDEL